MTTTSTGRRSDTRPEAISASATQTSATGSDAGLGLMEIVISMFMLALLALAFLPVLVEGLRLSTSNTTVATATQLAAEQMQLAQYAGPVCADVAALGAVTELTDSRGVELEVTTTTSGCTGSPTTIRVATNVVRLDTNTSIASASTIVYVGD